MKNLSLILLILIGFVVRGQVCQAQNFKLDEVKEIRLVNRDGGISAGKQQVIVVREKGIWKSYQTLLNDWQDGKPDTVKKFIKNVPDKVLTQLLADLANPDTAVVTDHFKLNNDSLIKHTAYVHPDMTALQKATFIKALQNETDVHTALAYSAVASIESDSGHYAISITTRANKIFTLRAQKWYFEPYLPWQYKGIKNYNPDILNIFYWITGNDKEAARQMNVLYTKVDKRLYIKHFETQFNWEHFKSTYPELYNLLNNTITPYEFVELHPVPNQFSDYRESYVLNSSRLPGYVHIYWKFDKPDTTNMRQFKRYEDTLATLFSKPNFLFDHLKSKEGVRVFVVKYGENGMEQERKIMYNNIRKYFASIEFYDKSQMHFLRVVEADGNLSHWIIFGDKLVVLADYTGDLNAGYETAFKGITPDLNAAGPHKNLKGLCLVFDPTGKRLGGTTDKVYIAWPF